MNLASLLDTVIETPIVPSFTRIGYEARSRADGWQDLDDYDLSGRVIVLTGATSGIGKSAALQLATCGATLTLVGRTEEKNRSVAEEIVAATGNSSVTHTAADMGDLDQVRALAAYVLKEHDRLDVLIHNAGALTADRMTAPDGTEATVASQVVGPFLLTGLLLDRLTASAPARVLTMSSGGMYGAPLTLTKLEMTEADYNGTEQYARAKRAQVTLNGVWSERFSDRGVSFHALHPGWADTPGVDAALPTFSKVVGPLLRTPAQGADTLVWLAADDAGTASSGEFWHDRRTRSLHKLRRTRNSDTPQRRDELWEWVAERAGYEPQ
jgi:NAD(P)-dependent dehydrogenase (short-subunit alcohol dehydrogenase family)